MHKDDVPQDNNPILAGARKAMYAKDENGHYVVVPSNGWEVEETVTSLALEEYQLQREQAFDRGMKGITSPLEYHMYANRLNIATLSQSTGIFKWRIKRHLKPEIFKGLDTKLLIRYADAMGISVEQLRQLPENK
jgi:hypothetical protein